MAAKQKTPKRPGPTSEEPDPRELVLEILSGNGERFTQDSPILPDVWLEFAAEPDRPVEVLITPHHRTNAGVLAKLLRERVEAFREHCREEAPKSLVRTERLRLAQSQSVLKARVHFEELVCVLLPMTPWWDRYIEKLGSGTALLQELETAAGRRMLSDALERVGEGMALSEELLWVVRMIGTIEHIRNRRGRLRRPDPQALVRNVRRLARLIGTEKADMPHYSPNPDDPAMPPGLDHARIWLVSLSRPVENSVHRSALAVKADAGRRLFEIDCSGVVWAVIDSGIDACHPCFASEKTLRELADPAERLARDRLPDPSLSRVTHTFDFTFIGKLLDPQTPDEELPQSFVDSLQPDTVQGARRRQWRTALKRALESGRDLDWSLVEHLVRIPDDRYVPPSRDHGTHVAGILGGDTRPANSLGGKRPDRGEKIGVCPDIELYDIRVFPEQDRPGGDERADEFGVVAAVQFVRHLNSQQDHKVVHGINLSLSIQHNVRDYACGRTPICEECNRTVAEGVVVVAAAGNKGFVPEGPLERRYGSYSSTSITDPGNADHVITVGSTHRAKPHVYGVSHFSSRGPTGDGRAKPDLVAPGEKVYAPSLDGGFTRKDGTSQAAPHVSGAAALLMARHSELIGDPLRIKQILCNTATDLGREPYFQGRGLVDVLRALQSI